MVSPPPRPPTRPGTVRRPVLYPLGRVGDGFAVGEQPVELGLEPLPLELGRQEPREKKGPGRIPVDDPWMSSRHARIVEGTRGHPTGGGGRLFIEDLGSKNGVVVNGALLKGKSRSKTPLLHGDIIETGRTFWVYVEERTELPIGSAPVELGSMATWVPRLGEQLHTLAAHAKTPEHVLVCGPEGSGKGFLARTLHQVSRRDGRFLHLACRERKAQRAAADLFGSESQPGKLRDGQGGTLLLEHVDALSFDLQDRLAEALRRRAVLPDGKTRAVALDVRVVGTLTGTAHDALTRGRLRPALYEALAQVVVDLPGLDQRLPDLGLLLDDTLARAKGAPSISKEACRVLFRHAFTQNVRGFARVVESAASLAVEYKGGARKGTIDLSHLPLAVAGADGIRALLRKALPQPGDSVELTNEFQMLSATGEDGSIAHGTSDGAVLSGFLGQAPTDAERRPLPAGRRPSTASVVDPSPVVRGDGADESEDLDPEALVVALSAAHGNVSAAARSLGKPRATVLKWVRELGIDPLAYR
jgi:DNA-binding NtrC family response regulator